MCFFSFQFRFKNYSADAAFTFTDSAIMPPAKAQDMR